MEKKTTPAITVIFYIIGILFLVAAAFMLTAAISYTRTYLQSYDAAFSDMWSNSVQYIIGQFAPYLGVGIVCLGIGKVIKEARNIVVNVDREPDKEAQAKQLAAADKIADRMKELAAEIEANREVLGIRIEEKEKRDTVRIRELEGDILYALRGDSPEEAVEEPAEAEAPAEVTEAEEPVKAEPAEVPPTPQIFTIARSMVMPKCPAQKKTPQIFTIARSMVMPACSEVKKTVSRETFSSDEL
ncbi:MAG: hypothetical protein MJ161_04595 [Clostridia bacterium]|nr:hypothetical protein [Clostridia bacterium]